MQISGCTPFTLSHPGDIRSKSIPIWMFIRETVFFLNPLSFFHSFIVLVSRLFKLYVSSCSCLL